MINPMALQQIMANQQNLQNFQRQFNQFAQQFQGGPQQMNPQMLVQQKLNSGEMTQAQFEQLRNYANMLTGMKY